jgi:uncharacterized repeat protein (TIGR01451 family)
MEFGKEKNIRRRILLALLSVIVFVPTYSTLAWGPERNTYKWEEDVPIRTFNSITDNPQIGNEREFVRIREADSGNIYSWERLNLEVGKEYEIYIYFHNNASASLNDSGAGMANNVRMRVQVPATLEKGEAGSVSAVISAANTIPDSVWDDVEIVSPERVYLRYVPDSAVIHSNGSVDGENLPGAGLFSDDGTPIGYSKNYWGSVAGGNEYAGFVTYRFKVDQPKFEISKEVSREAKNDWTESLTADAGEVLEFSIRYKNTGTTEQNDVSLVDLLPEGLTYLQGTTFLIINGSNPDEVAEGEHLFDNGLNIGQYQPGSEATLIYKVEVTAKSGDEPLLNKVNVVTANGTMSDSVKIFVNKEPGAGIPLTVPVFAIGAVLIFLLGCSFILVLGRKKQA